MPCIGYSEEAGNRREAGPFLGPVLDSVARAFRHLSLPEFSHEDALFAIDMLQMVTEE